MADQKNTKNLLRKFIKEFFLFNEGPVGASLTNPQDPKGFYSYDLGRGDMDGKFWYRSPGRSVGSDGDPGRPSDAMSYIGLKPPSPPSTDASPEISGDAPVDTDLDLEKIVS